MTVHDSPWQSLTVLESPWLPFSKDLDCKPFSACFVCNWPLLAWQRKDNQLFSWWNIAGLQDIHYWSFLILSLLVLGPFTLWLLHMGSRDYTLIFLGEVDTPQFLHVYNNNKKKVKFCNAISQRFILAFIYLYYVIHIW